MSDGKKQKNDGKYFEKRSFEIIGKINPTEAIAHNVRITGRFSRDRKRQIDVKLGDYDFVVFECKDWKTKIGPETVGQALSLFDDVGAKRGAVVSNSGFTPGAVNYAQAKSVDLLSLVDTDDPRIRAALATHVLVEDTQPRYQSFGVQSSVLGEPISLPEDPRNQALILPDGTPTTFYGVIRDAWNADQASEDVEWHQIELQDVQIEMTSGEFAHVDRFTVRYGVTNQFSTMDIGIESAEGMYNVLKNTFTLTSDHITFNPVNIDEIEDRATVITSEEMEAQTAARKFGAILGVKSLLPDEPSMDAVARTEVDL
jgi:hypothetical protein